MYEIEKGLELPKESAPGREKKYPFAAMEVGDSFFIACDADDTARVLNRTRSSAGKFVKRHAPDAAFRATDWAGGVRVWRVK